jgi:predicted ATPase/DNA-binding SARP family transcriptional activator
VQFRALGPLEVSDRGQSLDLGTPRQRRLLGLLLLHAGDSVTYDRLADGLWDGEPPPTARHTLQVYVHRLRLTLGDQAGRLETRRLGYQLKVVDGELDTRSFEDLVADGRRALVRGDTQAATSQLETALGLWHGLPFEDLGDLPAFEAERARLEALRLTAVEDRVDAALALGHHDAIMTEVEGLLTDHPYRERLWGQLMLARYRAGQADALAAFCRARGMLADELGLQPGRWLCRLQEQILLQDPALDAPEPARPAATQHNLPAPRDSFVGRGRELADLDGLLRTRRLVTITGPPGAGKTRLATAVALRLVDDWPHGVFLVPLAEVEDATLVPSVIATTLGVPAVPEQPVLDTLTGHLRSRRVLVVLDNVEHVLDAAPQLASLLDAAAALTVLATSRAPLRLAGEQEYPLQPLPVPPGGARAEEIGGNDAVRLFVDRTAAIDPEFLLTPKNSSLVTDVVQRLDGLPLAIELAAARLRSFSLADLHTRLEPALPLLTEGTVGQPPHHDTLRDAVAWSDDLLDPRHRVVLRRLAPFRGGITIEAAQAVIGDHEHGDAVGSLARLVEASLLGRPTHDEPPRYGMLETVREYALERLQAAGEEHDVRQRHATFHASLLAQAAPHLTQAGQAHWLERLDVEHANLRAALGWAVDDGEADLALEMAAGLWRYWQLRGHLAEARTWLTRALDLEGPSPLPHVRALIGLAGICYWQFDLDAAEATYRHAREAARELDWWLQLDAVFGLGMTLACHRGDLAEAKEFEAELWALVSEHDDEPIATGLALAAVQAMRLLAGDLEESRRYGEMCLEGTRQVGERWYELQVLRTLALTSLRQQCYRQARDELQGCVSIAFELGDLPGIAMDFDRSGQVAVLLGEPERGCVLAGVADRLREQVGETLTPEAFRWEKDRATVTASPTLGETEIARARARGRTLTLQQAAILADELVATAVRSPGHRRS